MGVILQEEGRHARWIRRDCLQRYILRFPPSSLELSKFVIYCSNLLLGLQKQRDAHDLSSKTVKTVFWGLFSLRILLNPPVSFLNYLYFTCNFYLIFHLTCTKTGKEQYDF